MGGRSFGLHMWCFHGHSNVQCTVPPLVYRSVTNKGNISHPYITFHYISLHDITTQQTCKISQAQQACWCKCFRAWVNLLALNMCCLSVIHALFTKILQGKLIFWDLHKNDNSAVTPFKSCFVSFILQFPLFCLKFGRSLRVQGKQRLCLYFDIFYVCNTMYHSKLKHLAIDFVHY